MSENHKFQDVQQRVEAYVRQYKISKPTSPEELISIGRLFENKEPWPYADNQGVYCIFSADEFLLYVGKASMSGTIGSRLGCHFWKARENPTLYEFDGTEEAWGGKPDKLFVYVVEHKWEAPSLEEYLIEKLKPSGNVRGVK